MCTSPGTPWPNQRAWNAPHPRDSRRIPPAPAGMGVALRSPMRSSILGFLASLALLVAACSTSDSPAAFTEADASSVNDDANAPACPGELAPGTVCPSCPMCGESACADWFAVCGTSNPQCYNCTQGLWRLLSFGGACDPCPTYDASPDAVPGSPCGDLPRRQRPLRMSDRRLHRLPQARCLPGSVLRSGLPAVLQRLLAPGGLGLPLPRWRRGLIALRMLS